MGRFYAKQPNGSYCLFSYVVDTVTYANISLDKALSRSLSYLKAKTEEEREMVKKQFVNNLSSFDDVLRYWRPLHQTAEDWFEVLRCMGYDIDNNKDYMEDCLNLEEYHNSLKR